MNEQTFQKAIHRGNRRLASAAAGFSKVAGLRRVIDTRKQIIARCACPTWPECDQERRFKPSTQNHVDSRLDEPKHARRRRVGTGTIRPAFTDEAGVTKGLLTFRLHTFSTGLRFGQAGYKARSVSNHGLHGIPTNSRSPTHGRKSSELEAGKKIKFRCPATGQGSGETSRHGTKSGKEKGEITYFVPPRYKIPHFWGWLRPATGHLYRFTIYQGFSCGSGWRCGV